jgi:hypothetical protein
MRPLFRRLLLSAVLLLTVASTVRAEDHLTVYAYPAPLGIDWRSPTGLAWSTLSNSLVSDRKLKAVHSIGHMNFHLQCDPSAEFPEGIDIETGQTNSDNKQMEKHLLSEGYGMGVMLADYSGQLETAAEIEADLPLRYQRGSIAFIDLKIKNSSCQRVAQYLKEYRQRGYDRIYGGLQRKARQGLGAGCASFTESVLEIAGVMMPEWKSYWSHSVNVPWRLIGGPLSGKKVSLLTMLFSPTAWRWNPSPKDSYIVTFWDPFYVYWWIRYANQGKASLQRVPWVATKRGHADGVSVDATALPTPTEDFWQP